MRWLLLVVLGAALALLGATERAAAQTAPGAPTIDAVTTTTKTLTVTWSPPPDDGGATISAYNLRYTEGDPTNVSDASWTSRRVWTSGPGALRHVVRGLRDGTLYTVQVKAVNSVGAGGWSDSEAGTTVDYGDTATTAATLVVSATTPALVAARIDSETDQDVFSFVLTEDAEIMVRSTGPVDVAGEVLNQDLTSAGTNNNARLPDNPWNFVIHEYLVAGTYYASVAGHDGATGPYEIHVEILPEDIPDYAARAATAYPGLVTAGRVGLSDRDYYKLEFSEPTDFYVVVFSGHATSGRLRDASQVILAESHEYYLQGELFLHSLSYSNDTGFMLRGTGEAGTYYIEVRSTDNADRGSYVMQVGEAPNPGSTRSTATPILPGAGAPGRISPVSDVDYFSISFDQDTAASVVAATVEYEAADLQITVYGEQDTPLDFHSIAHSIWDNEGREYVAGHAFGLFEAGETYKLRVRANAGEQAAYFLLFRLEEAYTTFATQCSALTADDAIDTFYGCQWHLNNTGQFPGRVIHDINVEEVWQAGNTGADVSIAIVDTGLYFEHDDLSDNVDRTRNFDYISMQYDGAYIHVPFYDSHGTAVAGLIAAEHNDFGVRGVAPGATIYNHNYLDSDQTLASEADAMTRGRVTTHISSNSWGPGDTGIPQPSSSTWDLAIETGLWEGDEGRGISYVFAGGNGSDPYSHDNSNLDGFANFYGVTAVCAIDHNDVRSSYSEPGANLWVCAPSSGAEPPAITTTGVGGAFELFADEAGSGYWPGLYVNTFGGTSAATPIVSGVVALVRSANPALTWRDVKLILAASARENDAADSGWEQGALRYGSDTRYYWFNHQYGFGAVDAGAAVALASGWTNVAPMRTDEVTSDGAEVAIATLGTPATQTVTFSDSDVDFIEFVEITVDLDHESIRDLKIELESPSGATSELVHSGELQFVLFGFPLPVHHRHEGPIRFGSAKHLGENPDGEWTLRITDELLADFNGTLKNFRVKVYGHTPPPGSVAAPSATTVGQALRVTWTAPGAGGAPANSYDVRYIPSDADKADPNWTLVTDVWTGGDLWHDLTSLTDGVRYDVQVRAVNVPQPGPWSETVIGIVGGAPGVLPRPATLTVPEGGSMAYMVDLASQPTADVTVEISLSGSADVTHSDADNLLTFTSTTWASPQTVTVSAVHDADYDDDTATISHSATSTDTGYQGISGGDVGVTVADDEESPLTVNFGARAYTVAEGRSGVVTVRLSPEPDRKVTIPLDRTHEGGATNADYRGVPDSVILNIGVTEQTFTVTAVNDTFNDDDEYIDLAFGTLPTGVTAGSLSETSIKIADSDFPDAVTVNFKERSHTVAESDDSTTPGVFENQVELTVTLTDDPDRTVQIPLIPANKDGARDADYSIVPTVLIFHDGDTELTSTFMAAHDGDDDDGEWVAIGFGNLPSGVIRGDGTAVNIADDDDPRVEVSFARDSYSVAESDDFSTPAVENQVTVTVTLSADPERTVDIRLSATNMNGALDVDYSIDPSVVRFNAGDTEASFTFTAAHDTEDDDDESVAIGFGSLPSRVIRGDGTTVNIDDDDVPDVVVSFGKATYDVDEGARVEVIVTLDPEPERQVVIPITASGAMVQDYSGVPGSVTFESGDTEKMIIFSATQDSDNDDGESVVIGFDSSDPTWPSQVATGPPRSTTVAIGDDDNPNVTVNFEQTAYEVAEGAEVPVTVTLSADPERSVTIPLTATGQVPATGQGAATSDDYAIDPASLALTFASGETRKSLTFSATDDDLDDDDESVRLVIGSVPGLTLGDDSEATVAIMDDPDDVPAVTVSFASSSYTVGEDSTVEVTLTLSVDPERRVAIPIEWSNEGNASDADYERPPSSVTFESGDTSKSITFSPVDDEIDDDGERVRLALGAPLPNLVTSVGAAAATVSITDNDARGVTVTPTELRIDEGSTGPYTVVLNTEPTADVTVVIKPPTNTDITVDETSLTFMPGNWGRVQSVNVRALDESDPDDDADDAGRITHTVSGGDYTSVGAAPVSVTVIDDEDAQVKVEFDRVADTVAEGGSVTFSVRLSKDPARTVTIPISVTHHDASIDDYTLSPTSVTFDAGGVLSQQVTLTAEDDTIDDDGESVTLGFVGLPSGGVAAGTINEATVSIIDNDAPSVTVRFERTRYTVNEGDSFSITATVSPDPKRTVTVPIEVTSEDAAGGNYGLPGSVTFDTGEITQSINFTATDDDVDDDNGRVIVRFDTSLLDDVSAGNETTVRITNDDQRGVTVTPADLTVPEGGSGSYEVVLTSQPTSDVSVEVTAPAGSDISVGSPELTFTAFDWSSAQTVTVSAADDDMDAEDDTGTITHAVSGGDYGSVRADPVSVTVDDDEVIVSFERATYSVAESGDAVTVTVRLNAATEQPFAIDLLKTEQGGATEDDYSALPDRLMFARGETEQSFGFSALSDTQDGEGESVLLEFGALPQGVLPGSPAQATLTITDVIRSTGTGGGGGGGGGSSGPSPSVADFEWNVKRDIEELQTGHDKPTGSWSDGTTLWLAHNGDGADDVIYAYDIETGERVEDLEFELDERNRAPRGVWSDGTTVWVSDSGQDTLFAQDLATGGRLPDADIALAGDNGDARGIWSDGDAVWVLDGRADSLFAYDLATGRLLAEYALAGDNADPQDVWSDGVTIWVSDHGAKRLFAYRLPVLEGPAAEDAEPQDLERIRDEEFGESRELTSASNNSPRGIWSDGDVMYVADEADGRVYTYNIPDAIDARLATLTLSGVDIGDFDRNRTDYEGAVGEGLTETTVEATTVQRRTTVDIDPADADGDDTNGHQVALDGVSAITVTVTSADGTRRRVYRVSFEPTVRELQLAPAWTSFEWPGADGIPVTDALQGSGVVVVYAWDQATGRWLAYFPGLEDVPGLNTLPTLTAGRSYWVAVSEPLTWTVATP